MNSRFALGATLVASLAAAPALAEDVKIGVILGFTGPIESLPPAMAASAELALSEINASGTTDMNFVPVRADSTCTDTAAATAAAENLIASEGVAAIMGPDCSGVTIGVLNNAAMPNGVVMISPSATSPALTTIEDNGMFYRTAPSDARQGAVLAAVLKDKGIMEVAVTYSNSDYGKGFSEAFIASYAEVGGSVTVSAPHEDGKGDYSAEVATLASAGGELLVVLGYADQGGRGVIQASVDTGAFDMFAMGDGMFADSLIEAIGEGLEGSIGTVPWSEGEGATAFASVAEAGDVDDSGPFTRESYDAAALLGLAIAAGASGGEAISAKVLEIANAPGEPILPGELGKAIEILKSGGDVDYVGATGVELIGPGEAAGAYREYVVQGGSYETVSFR